MIKDYTPEQFLKLGNVLDSETTLEGLVDGEFPYAYTFCREHFSIIERKLKRR